LLLWGLFLLLANGMVNAATYTLPGDVGVAGKPFSSCSFSSGTTYNCTSAISLGNNGTVNLTASLILNIVGNSFSAGNNVTINSPDSGFILLIKSSEDMNIGTNFTGVVNLQATGKTINISNNAAITGNLTASTLNIGNNGVIEGACTPSNAKCSGVSLLARYYFDDASWSGTTGEVLDSSGNGYNATAALAVTKNGSPGPAYSSGGQSTCRYGAFDVGSVSKSYAQLPNSFPALSTSFSVAAWINSTNASANNQRIFVRDDADNGWALSLSDGTGTSILRLFNRSVTFNSPSGGVVNEGGVAVDTTFQLSSNTWYFVAATVDTVAKKVVVYVYDTGGVQRAALSANFTGTWGAGTGNTAIGGETLAGSEGQQASWHFNGYIDEVQVYSGVLTQTRIQTLLQTVRICASSGGPDHYELSLPTSSISCVSTTASVTACADSSSPCTNAYTAASGTTASLSTSGGALGTGTVTFNSSGVATTTVSYPAASNGTSVSVTLSGEQIAATNGRKCCPDGVSCSGANSCSTTFNTAGFIFSNAANGASWTIPAQVAGTSSVTYYLRAVKTNTTTKACEAALTNPSAVNFAYECNNPATCSSSNLMSVNGGTATTISRNNNGSVASYSSVNMAFDGNGNAPFTLNFGDVGAVTLYASKAAGGSLLTALTGSTNSFVVAPASFAFSGITAAPIKAGNNFSATVTARTSAGVATPNFGKETVSEGVTLTFAKYQPTGAGAVNGSFSGSVGSFSGGSATASNLNWSEVGTIDLTATLASGSYLGSGLSATGNTGTTGAVGRFIPDHFDVAVTQGCSSGGFTYSGQPFAVSVTAKNGLAATTQNYDGSGNTTPNFSKAVTLSEANAVAGSLSPTSVAANAFAAGMASATPAFTFTTIPTAPATIKLRTVDTDAVTSASGTEGTAAIRSGRLRIFNAFGSEKANLGLPVQAQYWSGQSWVLNSQDSSCTTVPTNAFNLIGAPTGTSVNAAVTISGGNGTLTLTKPSPTSTGSVDIAANLGASGSDQSCLASHGGTAANLPWLRSRNGNCASTYDRDPSARASFGIYSPETKRTIHVREQF
jgi:MSHA biogenesis protein MshQ